MRKLAILFIFSIFCFVSCISTGDLEDYYKPFISDDSLSKYYGEECFLKEGEEPKVYYSSNLNDDIAYLKSNYYIILGWSSFNGPADDDLREYTTNFCKLNKALIGLYSYRYTDTRYGVISSGDYVSSYNIKRYDYDIVLFISEPDYYIQNQITGFTIKDLDTNSRQRLQRNTGVVVDVVYSKTNAFYANIINDDVITKINGVDVIDSKDYYSIYNNIYKGQNITLTIIRNGFEREISYKL